MKTLLCDYEIQLQSNVKRLLQILLYRLEHRSSDIEILILPQEIRLLSKEQLENLIDLGLIKKTHDLKGWCNSCNSFGDIETNTCDTKFLMCSECSNIEELYEHNVVQYFTNFYSLIDFLQNILKLQKD